MTPMTPTPGFTLDRATHTIRLERRIRATPDWLFRSWTDPARLSLWWDPAGAPLARCDVDLRVGGVLHLATAAQADHPFIGTYTRIEPPHRLDFEAMGAAGTVTFQADGEATEMRVEIRCRSEDHLADFLRFGVAEGTARTVDNLVALADRSRAA